MSEAVYDEIADWYDNYISEGSQSILFKDLILPGLLNFAGNVEGMDLLDLACGQGIVSREFARRGARVVGVDVSLKLLEIARSKEEVAPLNISYKQGDARTLTQFEADIFDGVACNMALMDIPDLAATFRSVNRVLKEQGWFTFVITHPCFQTPDSNWIQSPAGDFSRKVNRYFAEGFWRSGNPAGVRFRVGANHRTLGTYLNNLIECGFMIQRIQEPQATGLLAEMTPGYVQTPPVLIVKACKTPG